MQLAKDRGDAHSAPAGVALVAVLAVLTVLAIVGATFVVRMQLEQASGATAAAKCQSATLARSGLEHALCLLRQDAENQPAWDDLNEEWAAHFRSESAQRHSSVDVAGLSASGSGERWSNSRWLYVHDEGGRAVGRYAVLVEDESAKINVNTARALSPDMQNEGVGTFEVMLTDGSGRGLGLSLASGKNILRFRYGRDLKPGKAEADDNFTAVVYSSDEIDNDANGLVDEPEEGTDEPEEYDPMHPRWDDRVFASVREALVASKARVTLGSKACRRLQQYATVHSRSASMYWDEQDRVWRPQSNPNVASSRQILKLLRRANRRSPFEPSARNLRRLVANVVDYRDENHVLSTVSGEYGVEAVCFNEIMANDGSFTAQGGIRYGYWYNPYDKLSFDSSKREDRYGWRMRKLGAYESAVRRDFLTNGMPVDMRTVTLQLGDPGSRLESVDGFGSFKAVLSSTGWPIDLWKNACMAVAYDRNPDNTIKYRIFPIGGNDNNTLYIGVEDRARYDQLKALVDSNATARLETFWHFAAMDWCVFPQQSEYYVVPTALFGGIKPPPDLYYFVYIADQTFAGNVVDGYISDPFRNIYKDLDNYNSRPMKGFCKTLDTDGHATVQSETRMEELREEHLRGTTLTVPSGESSIWLKRTPYKNRAPIHARNGFLRMLITSSRNCGYGIGRYRTTGPDVFGQKNCMDAFYAMRPDIIEVINISHRAISLRNWRVIINTGSYADQVGLIDHAVHYSSARRGRYDDPNPVIPAGGYFYLTNHRGVFDEEYGDGSGKWGTSSSEAYGCYELPDYLWGARYKVSSVSRYECKVKGANWKRDQMKGEIVEFQTTKHTPPDRNSLTGNRKVVYSNTRNSLYFGGCHIDYDGVRPGDDAVILGMPREGGFLSMTLKNEYQQVAARTIEYGSTKIREVNHSTVKLDPTHYTWRKASKPTFGGTMRKARSRMYRTKDTAAPFVKNNRYSSVAEIQKVRSARDWENVGEGQRGRAGIAALRATTKYFTVSGVRLDPEEDGAHVRGWQPAFGAAIFSSAGALSVDGVDWGPGIWKGHTLRITSGALKGERFYIVDNTRNSIRTEGYSCPGRKQLRVAKGDTFSVGPGYATSFYYTRHSADSGVWEWKHKGLEPGAYGLYIFGLNDSIVTTEFLEENHNAELEVAVFNFRTREFDAMPPAQASRDANDVYAAASRSQRLKYRKSDGVYCGRIRPEHISPDRGIRLRLTAHNLADQEGSGLAWFDYAYLAPGTVRGKINVNTAPKRVLRALKGVTGGLARNILAGRSGRTNGRLKPYKDISDILDVEGVTPEVFTAICNLLTTRSDQHRIQVVAEALTDVNADGVFDARAGDRVLAHSRVDTIVDRSELTDNDPNTVQFKILHWE